MECPFCNSKFASKQNLKKHLNKKFKCKSNIDNSEYENLILELEKQKYTKSKDLQLVVSSNPVLKNIGEIPNNLKCLDCGTIFKCERSIYYHKKHVCTSKTTENIILDKLEELDSKIKSIIETKPSMTYINNGTINNQQNIQNFKINDWGKEDLSFLNISDIIEAGPWQTVPNLFQKIHFNPTQLKNYNCRIPPGLFKTKLMEIRKDGKWIKCIRFSELAEKEQYLRNFIIDYAEENKDKIPVKKYERILEYRDIMESRNINSKEYKELISKLELIGMNDFITMEEGLNALLDDNLDLLDNINQ
jgi:uncharacterized C2H2 Zn-finger protein